MTYNEFYEIMRDYDKKRRETKMISGIDRVKLSAPWYTLLHEYVVLFKGDKDVDVVWDDDERRLDIRVHDLVKADALAHLLPHKYMFGDDVLTVRVIPPKSTKSKIDLFRKAFEGNCAISRIESVTNPAKTTWGFDYVVFNREVVQFFDDNVGDINGNKTLLYEDIARDIFNIQPEIFFCTEGEPK